MGGHGGLNILPHKSWNVYGFKQRQKVARDEAAMAAKREAEESAVELQRKAAAVALAEATEAGAALAERRADLDAQAKELDAMSESMVAREAERLAETRRLDHRRGPRPPGAAHGPRALRPERDGAAPRRLHERRRAAHSYTSSAPRRERARELF